MKALKHKILDLLGSFSNFEIKGFRKFISSSYFTGGRDYSPLLNAIAEHIQNEEFLLDPKKLYAIICPGKKFSSQTLKNRLTELFKLAEDYMVYMRLSTDHVEREKLLLQEYLNRKLLKLFAGKYKKTKSMVDLMPDNESKFRSTWFLKGINLNVLDNREMIDIKNKEFYERSMYSLCIFLIEIFQISIEFKVLEYEDLKFEPNIIEEISRSIHIEKLIISFSQSGLTIQKVVCMYYYLYMAFAKQEEEHYYFEMRKLFKELMNSFSGEYKETIYKSIINYCMIKQNSGSKEFQQELFNIYNEKLKQGLLSEFRQITYPVNTFRDYVLIGIEMKEFKWVEEFINKYSKELPEEIRSDETNLSYAKLYFSKREFTKAIEPLNRISANNYLHYMDASVLKMCCYFEFDKMEESFYEIDKFKHYIRNHKEIPEIHKVPNLNFIKIYQKIMRNRHSANKTDLGFLNKEIRSLKFISKGEWLLEKVGNNKHELLEPSV